jgi:hypothetical protein
MVDIFTVPEPATLSLLAMGFLFLKRHRLPFACAGSGVAGVAVGWFLGRKRKRDECK